MKTILLFLFLIISVTVFGQGETLIITYSQNDNWIDSLTYSPIQTQINMIKKRIIHDTAIYYPGMIVPIGILRDKIIHIPQNYVAGLDYSKLVQYTFKINGIKGEGRLLFAYRLKDCKNKYDFIQIKRDTSVRVSTIREITEMISTNNVSGLEIIKNCDEKFALFGSSYGFGVIILDLNSKKDHRRIKNINE